MKNKAVYAIMLALLSVSFLAWVHMAEAQGTPAVYLNPFVTSAPLGTSFSIDVVVEDVAELVAWEFKLYWNNSLLECATDIVHTPTSWENHIAIGPGIEQDYNATQGRYFRGLTVIPTQENDSISFSGNMTIVTLTFNVKAEGSCVLDLGETKLVNYVANPIDHKARDGYFQSQAVNDLVHLRTCAAIAAAFGAKVGDPMWKPFADINLDGIIDIYDMVIIAGELEETR